MLLYPHISADEHVRAGRPVIEGTSIPVSQIVSAIAAGKNISDVAQEYGVRAEDVQAALEYAAQRAGEPVVRKSSPVIPDKTNDVASVQALAEEESRRLGLDFDNLSELGKRLIAIRAQGIAAGEPRITTWEELDAEISERRGGVYSDSNE